MCGIRRHRYIGCNCSYTYGDITPCYEDAQGSFNPLFVTQDEDYRNMSYFKDGVDWKHISMTNTNHPFHPVYWSCDTTCVERIEPPQPICPLHFAGTAKKPSPKPEPKLDPASQKWLDEQEWNISALLPKQ